MKPGKVRSIAICVFRVGNKILVAEGYDQVKKQVFYRPLGGTIEFGESAAKTIQREIQEELNLDTMAIKYIGTLENIFTYEGLTGHEIVLIFDGEFQDAGVYHLPVLHGIEGDGAEITATWKELGEFSPGNSGLGPPLYPTGLLELLQDQI
ncbi:MAG: hydrolase [Chloroflexi bacterium]|nr:hydrolase [Chloroflexota bacterium]